MESQDSINPANVQPNGTGSTPQLLCSISAVVSRSAASPNASLLHSCLLHPSLLFRGFYGFHAWSRLQLHLSNHNMFQIWVFVLELQLWRTRCSAAPDDVEPVTKAWGYTPPSLPPSTHGHHTVFLSSLLPSSSSRLLIGCRTGVFIELLISIVSSLMGVLLTGATPGSLRLIHEQTFVIGHHCNTEVLPAFILKGMCASRHALLITRFPRGLLCPHHQTSVHLVPKIVSHL